MKNIVFNFQIFMLRKKINIKKKTKKNVHKYFNRFKKSYFKNYGLGKVNFTRL